MRVFPGARPSWRSLAVAGALVALTAGVSGFALSGCGGRESLEPADLGDPGTGTTIDSTAPVSAATQSALMTRWNATVDAVGVTIDFHWRSYDQFPHPNFKGGTPQAVQQFATILLAFYQRQDDFQYLASNHLFTTPLRYVYASGQIGLDTTFEMITADFSTGTSSGNVPMTTRQGLQGYLGMMQ